MPDHQTNAAMISSCIEDLYQVRYQFADRLYDTLFKQLPQVRALFRHDRQRQHMMLFSIISMLVKGMEADRDMSGELIEFGRIHHKYGVREEQFPVFGAVFLQVMIDFLPERDHPDLAQAWWGFYTRIYEPVVEGLRAEQALQATSRRLFGPRTIEARP